MRTFSAIFFLAIFNCQLVAANQINDVELPDPQDVKLSTDSLNNDQLGKDINYSQMSNSTDSDSRDNKYNKEVFLKPLGSIKTSYANENNYNAVLMLRNSLNLTRLNYSDNDDLSLLTTPQTEGRIQEYFTNTVESILSECNVKTRDINDEYPPNLGGNENASKLISVNLGVSKLIINKTLLTVSLNGEAISDIKQNGHIVKTILLSSGGGTRFRLNNFNSDGLDRDKELKIVSSDLVDSMARKMGEKLCQYFN